MTPDTPLPGWLVVATTELRRLWLGWRGPGLLLALSLALSVYILLLSLDPEINVLSQRRLVDMTIQTTVLVGIAAVLLLGADAFSGERDQRSLESLLLTPVPRQALIFGKLLAILSLWFGMLPLALPYLLLVAGGTGSALPAALLLALPGTMLVWLCAAVAVLVSSLAPNNLASFALSFAIVFLLAAPTQLPGAVQELPVVSWLVAINPLTAVSRYQAAVLLDDMAWTSGVAALLSPLAALALAAGLAPLWVGRRLSLVGGVGR